MKNEQGASLVEYAVLVALIAVVALLAVMDFGNRLNLKYIFIGTEVGKIGH